MEMTRTTKRFIAIIAAITLATSTPSFTNLGNMTAYAATATNGIVKGSDTPGVESSFTTTLNSGENVSLKIVDSILTIKVDASEYNFQIGNITKTTDAAVVNEKDGLLHILTLGGLYYVFDLYTGVQIVAYRNSINGKYCSKRNSYAYEVYGKSLINNTYFYELLTSNSVSRELLMTRGEFDVIVNGGDPSLEEESTELPTVAPTEKPTEAPTVAPTEKPTEASTEKPTNLPGKVEGLAYMGMPHYFVWKASTDALFYKVYVNGQLVGTTESTYYNIDASYFKEPGQYVVSVSAVNENGESEKASITYIIKAAETPTEAPTERPTETPTEKPTEKPTQVPTEQPTMKPIEVPTLKPIEISTTATVKTEFDFEFWWKQYVNGTITWEQFSQAVWQNQWVVTTEKSEQTTTYYFYDDEGKLIRTETITYGQSAESGQGQGTVNGNSSGSANANATANGNGGGTGSSNTIVSGSVSNNVVTNSAGNVVKPTLSSKTCVLYVGDSKTFTLYNVSGKVSWSRSNKNVSFKTSGKYKQKIKVKAKREGKTTVTGMYKGTKYKIVIVVKHSRVVTSGNKIRIFKGRNRYYGGLYFNPKKGILKYNGFTAKNVKAAGFIAKSWNVVYITKDGVVHKLPKRVTSGKKIHASVIKCTEASGFRRNYYGFVTSITLKCGGLKGIKGR